MHKEDLALNNFQFVTQDQNVVSERKKSPEKETLKLEI